MSPAFTGGFFTTEPPGESKVTYHALIIVASLASRVALDPELPL